MRALICAALLCVAGPAMSDMVFRDGKDSVKITERACYPEMSGLFHPGVEAKAADAEIGGKQFRACWVEMNGLAVLIYEDGDQGMIPMGAFKPVASI